jgi:predicted nucleic acid-binding protein
MGGVTVDTGALIALERADRRMLGLWRTWARQKTPITVPSVVVAEWWRNQRGPNAVLLEGIDVEMLDETLARIAGRALAELRLGREHTIDAIVMASAAQRGDVVYTSDFEDLTRLTGCFPAVRVLGV